MGFLIVKKQNKKGSISSVNLAKLVGVLTQRHNPQFYQISIFNTIKEWVKGEGRSAIAVVHDLNIVYTYGTKALLMNEGRIYSYGDVENVLKRENLKKVYEVDVAQWMQSLLKHWQ